MKTTATTNYTSDALKKKILAKESFWVATDSERKTASTIAKTLGIKFVTGSDDRGGFYVIPVPKVKIPTK